MFFSFINEIFNFCINNVVGKLIIKKGLFSNKFSLSTELLDRTNVVYIFTCPLGDCVSKENYTYVGLTTTTLSRRLTMHLDDSSSIALHLKTHSIPKSKFRKILIENTTIIAHEINKLLLYIDPRPSIKRCTCVNKRKNSGSKWVWGNNITRCPEQFESVGERMPAWEPACSHWGLWVLNDQRLSNPNQDEKEMLLWSREELRVNIPVCPRLQLTSHTQ